MPSSDQQAPPTVTVGVDGSDASVEAAGWAAGQAQATGARLEVVCAWQGVLGWGMAWGMAVPIPADYDPAADAGSMVSQVVETLRGDFPTVSITTRVVEGHPAEVLVEASRHTDLLVVSNRGHGEFAGMLLGSVSQHCAARAHCPVVIVRGGDD